MNRKELRDKIIKEDFMICSGPCNFQLGYAFMVGVLELKKYYKKYHEFCFLNIKNNFAEQIQLSKCNYDIIKQLFDNPENTVKIITDWENARDEHLAKIAKYVEDIGTISNDELLKRYDVFMKKYIEMWGPPLITDYMGEFAEGDEDLSNKEYVDYMHPDKPSFARKEQLSLWKIAEKLKKGEDVEKDLEEHQKNFFWIENNYLNIKILSKEYFLEKAKKMDELEEEPHKDIPDSFPSKLKEKLELTKKLTSWHDERKEVNLITGHHQNELLKEISKRTKVEMDDLYYYSPEEVMNIFNDKADVSSRKKEMVFLVQHGDENKLWGGDEAKEIIDTWEIKNSAHVNHWWREEFPGCLQYAFYMLHGYMCTAKMLKSPLSSCIISYSKGMIREDTRIDERYEMYKELYENTKKDKEYLKKQWKQTDKEWKEIVDNHSEFVKKKENLSNDEVLEYYKKHFDEYVDWIGYPAAIEGTDVFTDFHLYGMVKKELPNLSNEELREYIHANTGAKCLSFMEEQRLEMLKLCVENYNDIEKANAKKLSDKFYYMNTNYRDVYYLDEEYFLKQMMKEVTKDIEEIENELKSLQNKVPNLIKKKQEYNYKISQDLRLHLDIVEEIGKQMDLRKEMMTKANNLHFNFVEEISKRFEIPFKVLRNYTYEEVKELLKTGKKVSQEMLDKREDYFFYFLKQEDNFKGRFFYGDDAKQLIKEIDEKKGEDIKGMVASAPIEKIDGKVQVILNVKKEKFEAGNILVTTMTRPEFLPIMRKASAIITDEGGLTCHAAIVSRELKIPCIIGAKIATKKLKSGDLVEMDLKEGKVKRL